MSEIIGGDQSFESIDLRTIEKGRYIIPSEAEGPEIQLLETKDFKVPASLKVKDRRFRVNGIERGMSKGFVISGVYSEESIKINHIMFDEELRRTGISRAALIFLESEMKKRGVKVVYASFANTDTINFFLKNQYEIISYTSLKDEEKKSLVITDSNFDLRVNNKIDFENLKNQEGNKFLKILLRHNL